MYSIFMLIKSVHLNNIRSYLDSVIELPKGSVLLNGDVGSGKTTILLAIEFALFGADNEKVSGNSLLRKGTEEGFVEMHFSIGNSNIEIKRTLKRKGDSVKQKEGYIVIDDVKSIATSMELKSKVIELLGYPEELISKKKNYLFRYTVYTPQENMKEILDNDIESRIDILRKIFQIEKYQNIKKSSNIYLRYLRQEKKILSEETKDHDIIVDKKKEKQENIQKIRKYLDEKHDQIDILNEKIEDTKNDEKKIEESIIKYREKSQLYHINKTKIQSKNNELETIKQRLQSIKSQIVEEIEEIDENILIYKQEKLNEISNKKKIILNQKEYLSKEIERIRKDLENIKLGNISELKSKYDNIKNDIEEHSDIIDKQKNIKEKLERISNVFNKFEIEKEKSHENKKNILHLSKCPTCQQSVSKEHKDKIVRTESQKIEHISKNIDKFSERKKELRSILDNIESKINDINKKQIEIEKISIKIKQHENEIKEKRKKQEILEEKDKLIKDINKEIDILNSFDIEKAKKEVNELKDKLEKYKKNKILKKDEEFYEKRKYDLKKEINEFNLINEDLQKFVDMLEKTEESHKIIRKERYIVEEKLNKLKIDIAENKSLIRSYESEIKILNEIIENKKKKKDKIKRSEKIQGWFEDFFSPLVSSIEKSVLNSIYNQFNSLFQEWFSELIEDENMSCHLDESFSPVIIHNGYEIGIKYLSGGERTSCALAYRLALNKVINDMISHIKTKDILILDEPTDGFSTQQLDKIRDVLDKINAKQLIIVSHEEKIESFVKHIIRVEKNNNVSNASNISNM